MQTLKLNRGALFAEPKLHPTSRKRRPKFTPDDVLAIIDTREQLPLALPLRSITDTLPTGDYSVSGFEDLICVERKSLPDLIGCMTSGRSRFERELQRMKAYEARCVVVEASWRQLRDGDYRSRITPEAATHSVVSWLSRFAVPFLFVDDRASAADAVAYFLYTSTKKYYERYKRISE
jgi:DNA excision repair protein ERCC-4